MSESSKVRKLLESIDTISEGPVRQVPNKLNWDNPDKLAGQTKPGWQKMDISNPDTTGGMPTGSVDTSKYRELDEEYNEAAQDVEAIQGEMADLLFQLEGIIRQELPRKYANLEAYLIAPLKIAILGDESGYASRDANIPQVIAMLEDSDEGEDEY
jgi:hypothetical protein